PLRGAGGAGADSGRRSGGGGREEEADHDQGEGERRRMRDPIIAPAIPPAGAKQVGTHTDGRAIYEMEVRVKDGIQAAVRDGKEVWVKNPATGEPLRQVYETVYKVERKRFVIEQMPNGTNFLNFHFEESAEVKA